MEMKSQNTTLNNYQGIDVSNHQGLIDWSLVSKDENIKFVYIKATEGATAQLQYVSTIPVPHDAT